VHRPEDRDVVAALRAGDEDTFARLVADWSRSMLMLARSFVATDASAEEVVQDTWLAVVKGIDKFEGRSSLRTWVYRILVNTAKRRGERESRTLPWTSVVGEDGPSLDPALFQSAGEPNPGGWRAAPAAWPSEVGVEGSVLASEVRDEVRREIEKLPVRQRTVITLRDVLGYSSEDVARLLDLSATNQRVLLHRARSAVRAGIASYLESGG
jgi:RNA polymerase sigma-70 factor (ECF subfamily)